MTPDEKAIMADMFYFLRDHADPPANGTEDSVSFWKDTAKEISRLVCGKWHNHALAIAVGTALYDYLGGKRRTKEAVS